MSVFSQSPLFQRRNWKLSSVSISSTLPLRGPQSAGLVKEAFLPMLHATGNIEDGSLFVGKKREIYVMRVGDSLERKVGG